MAYDREAHASFELVSREPVSSSLLAFAPLEPGDIQNSQLYLADSIVKTSSGHKRVSTFGRSTRETIVKSVAIISISLLSSCSFAPRIDNALLNRLKNRGPVQLSPDNPFLAANLMLAQESDRSLELRGFLEHRGAPAALEVRKGFWNPLELKLYYVEKRETYVLEDSGGTWAIRGPESLSLEIANLLERKLRGDETSLVAERPPGNFNRFTVPTPSTHLGDEDLAELLVEIPAPAPTRKPMPTRVPKARATVVPVPTKKVRPTAVPETLTDDERSRMAEVSPRGDVVHYVTLDGETMRAIARWYTGEVGNEGKIARMNNTPVDAILQPGDTIVVPSYLVQNKFRLTESALRALQVLQEEERGQ